MRRMAGMQKHLAIVHVGKAIREKRKGAGWSQEAFADSVDLDRSYYGKVERGEVNFSLILLFRVAAGLRCEPAEFMPALTALRKLPKVLHNRGRRAEA